MSNLKLTKERWQLVITLTSYQKALDLAMWIRRNAGLSEKQRIIINRITEEEEAV